MAEDMLKMLIEVRELLSDKSHWTTGVYAKDKWGNQVGITSLQAVCWCLGGAISKFCLQIDPSLIWQTEKFLIDVGHGLNIRMNSVESYNDSSSYEEILFLLDTAIERRKIVKET